MERYTDILAYLNYKEQTIEDLWDSPNHAIFAHRMNDYGTLILTISNPTNDYLTGVQREGIGKSLYEIYGTENATMRHAYFYKWKDIKRPFSYIYEYMGESWVATIEVKDNALYGIVRRGRVSEHSKSTPLFDELEVGSLSCKNTITLIIAPREDGFGLTSYNKAMERLTISPELAGKAPQEVLDYFIDDDTKDRLMECLKASKEIKKVIQLSGSNASTEKLFFHIHIIPLVQTDSSSIIIRAKDITTQYCAKSAGSNGCDYEHLFSTDLFGVCALKPDKSDGMVLDSCNDYFKCMINKNAISIGDITNARVTKDCMDFIKINSGYIVKADAAGAGTKYLLNCVPVLIGEKLDRVLVFISPEEGSVAKYVQLKAKLTSREVEMLGYVADGFTNRYISTKLGISEGTVKRTIYNAYKKLGIGSRVELVRIFLNI